MHRSKTIYDRMSSDMISKKIESLIAIISLKKLMLHIGGYEWAESAVLIRNNELNILCLLFKSNNSATRIGVSNLQDKIYKETLANDGNNVKDLIYDVVKSVDVCPSTGLSIRCPSLGLK